MMMLSVHSYGQFIQLNLSDRFWRNANKNSSQ